MTFISIYFSAVHNNKSSPEPGWPLFRTNQKILCMSIKAILEQKREDILRLAAKYGAFNVRIFGSAGRGDEGPESDIDLLVEMEPDRSLFDLVGLQDELQSLLGCDVDIVTEKGLHWFIRDKVINEARQL